MKASKIMVGRRSCGHRRVARAKRRGTAAKETAIILPVFFVLVMYSLQVATVVLF